MEFDQISDRHNYNHRNNHFSYRVSNKPFFIDPWKSKKKRIEDHQSLIINIFKNWDNDDIKKSVNKVQPYAPLPFDLYINITDQVEKLDQYDQALTHLKHPSYAKIQSIYNELKDKEGSHNKRISEYFDEIYDNISDIIKSESSIQETSIIRKAIENNELTERDRIGLKNELISPMMGYYSEHLFEYLLKRSTINKVLLEKDLIIKDLKHETKYGGRSIFYFLKSNTYLDEYDVIAVTNAFRKKDIQILKDILLRDDFIEITNTLKKFESDVQDIQKLYSDFIYQTNRIVNEFPSLDLKGKCLVEEKLRLKNAVKSFFHRN